MALCCVLRCSQYTCYRLGILWGPKCQIPLLCRWSTDLYRILYWWSRVRRNVECRTNILLWMRTSFMMCNTDKIEMMVFSSTSGPAPQSIHLKCSNDIIPPENEVKNIGVIFDENMKPDRLVNRICQTAHLRPGHTALYGLITAKTRQKVVSREADDVVRVDVEFMTSYSRFIDVAGRGKKSERRRTRQKVLNCSKF